MSIQKKYLQRIDLKKDLLSLRSIINWILFVFTFGLFVLAIRDIGFPNPDKDSMFQIHNRYFQACYIIIGVLYLIRSIFFRGGNGNRKVFITQFVIGIILVLFFFPVFLVSYGDIFEYYLYQTSGIQMFAFFLFFF